MSKSGQPEVIATPTAPPITALTSTNGTTPTPETEPISTPQPGDIGRVVRNASLINEATWTVEPSPVNRVLTFKFYVEAASNGDKIGSVNATLFREGKDICTISVSSKTSPQSGGVHYEGSNCQDTLVKNSGATYGAKVKVLEMTPTKIYLDYVDAVQK
ncbi:hypothetical protein [Nostoc sp. PCC 7107]|uniref:hypothetical protein n=1 Tax=Nostoc sp. PCC 7107 TaxID=317936 RepID=UPI00029F06FB|nr:hypothetical protein [Nostoc sp. PCC 7107]AFY44368.1 hypothetical protein Nos7107_3807 [Nostoc sp. PCC 7107]